MRKMILVIPALLLITLANIGADAQNTEKKDGEKSKTSTVDVWRGALPESEQTSDTPPVVVMEESVNNVENRETEAEIEKRVLDLQSKLMEAVKKRDSATLNYLLADDFTPVGATLTEAQADKTRYIQSTLKNSELKNYIIEKATVRPYRTTAIVTVRYKQQSMVGGVPTDTNFIATDVWVKRGKLWQAVSHHVSQLPKTP